MLKTKIMKRIFLILIAFTLTLQVNAQFRRVLLDNELLTDTTITIYTNSPGYASYFLSTDTLYGSTKDATFEIKQGYKGETGARIDSGFSTLSDTLNEVRLIKKYTPGVDIENSLILTKNSIDSVRITLVMYWHSFYNE